MTLSKWLLLLALVCVAGAATVLGASALARMSVLQQTLLVDGAKAVLALLIVVLCLWRLTLVIRR